jgi:Tol biopolymer transport system component
LYELRIRDGDAALEPHAIETVPPNPQQHGAWTEAPDASKDGTLATFLSDRAVPFDYDLYVMGPGYTTPRPLHVTGIAHCTQNPRFAPDGKSVFFLAGTEENRGARAIYSLWRVNVNDGISDQIADSGLFTNSSRWRPR